MLNRQNLHILQSEIMAKVDTYLENGAKHISVVLGPGCGKTTIALIYARELSEKANVVYIPYNIVSKEYAQKYFSDNGINVRTETIKRFTNEIIHGVYTPGENDIWIIDEAHEVESIYDLQKRVDCCAFMATTISFFDPLQNLENSDDSSEVMLWDSKWDLGNSIVQVTENAIDFRLSSTEEPERCKSIRNDVAQSLHEHKNIMQDTIKEYKQLENKLQELSVQENELKQVNEALSERITILNKKLDDDKKKIDTLTMLCKVQSAMLTYLGISENDVTDAIEQIETVRVSLQDQLASPDNEIVERAYQLLQDKVVNISVSVVERTIPMLNVTLLTEQLTKVFTVDIWNRLTEKSRKFLVSAKYMYETMIRQDFRDQLDYSGVCLLVTKAVEVEVWIRFFDEYKNYLQKNIGYDVKHWPRVMTYMDRNGNTFAANDFSLGSLIHIVGYRKGQIVDQVFVNYAAQNLYPEKERNWIISQLKSVCDFVEKVRLDYRNPASHKDSLKQISATSCIEYVVELHKKLKEMLEKISH